MRVTVNTDKCISSGQCVMAAPDVFDQHEDSGMVWLLTARPAPEHQGDIEDAALACPVQAITVSPE